ncbi:MAG TPA: RNA methyltransferase [Pyrinomonadaceae bacterium]
MITSRDNQLARRARAVREGKIREQIFVEGVRLCEEAVRSALSVEQVICTEKLARDERGAQLLQSLSDRPAHLSFVTEEVFASLSDTKTPQGILLLAARPFTGREALERAAASVPLLIVMHRLNNPSNAGAILRTAEAAGVTGCVLTEGTTDIFSPKALRGAMGSSFRVPVWAGARWAEVLEWCGEHGIRTVCADPGARLSHTELEWTAPRALIVGAEAAGLRPDEIAAADEALRIPMRAPVESLNVAVATAVVLYEAARQRELWTKEVKN